MLRFGESAQYPIRAERRTQRHTVKTLATELFAKVFIACLCAVSNRGVKMHVISDVTRNFKSNLA